MRGVVKFIPSPQPSPRRGEGVWRLPLKAAYYMSVIKFISSRFHAVKTLPRSIKAMRFVAIVGIAIAVAALIIAMSVGRGFEKKYIEGLLNFNAHIVIMSTNEIDKPYQLMNELNALRIRSEDERRELARWKWIIPLQASLIQSIEGLEFLHEDVSFSLSDYPALSDIWDKLNPQMLHSLIPTSIVKFMERLNESSLKGLKGMTPFIYRESLAIGGGNIRGVIVKGVDPQTLSDVSDTKVELKDKNSTLDDALRSTGDGVNIILGKSLGDKFKNAESIRLMIPEESGEKFLHAKVAGVFESGIHDYDSQFILMSLPDVRRLYDMDADTISGIELRLEDPLLAKATAKRIDEILGPTYETITWGELNEDLIAAVELERLISAIIMGIMLFVAALNVIAVMVLIMIHRIHELAILKAIGLSDRMIEAIFIRGAMAVVITGMIFGSVLGICISALLGHFSLIPLEAEIYMIDALPIDISLPICGMISVFCIIIGYLAAKIASRKLARAPVIEGLSCTR